MTRYLIGLFLGVLVLTLTSTAHAQTTTSTTETTSTSETSSSSTSSTTSTSSSTSTSNTVPCLAIGQPCGLDTDCCSGICGDFGLCVATSTTSTSSSVTTSTSTSVTTSTSSSTSVTTTTSTSSTSTSTTLIKIDPQGCLVVAQADDGPSEIYVWPDPDRAMAIHFYVDAGASTSTQIEVSQDMSTWIPVGAAITADGTTTIQQPSGIYRVNSTTATGTVTVCYGMSLPR